MPKKKEHLVKPILIFFAIFLFFSFGFLASRSISENMSMSQPQPPSVNNIPNETSDIPTKSPNFPIVSSPNLIADIVEKVGDGVVNIDVVKMAKQKVFNPFGNSEDFGFGFRLNPEFQDMFKERLIPLKGAGSGFIIDQKGYILTNSHVVKEADKIKVTLKNGKSYDAKIIGSDTGLDLAVIKIDAPNLPVLKMGDSSKLRIGEWIIAIGNPYQFSNTVTVGIVSALGRRLEGLEHKDLIQTDAAINPGNSGGPLLDLKGEVVGINVAIAAGAEGIGFAIPINAAKTVLDELITKGRIIRPWLGIYMRDVDEKAAKYLDLPVPEGVIIMDVAKDSPAEKMGLKKYDVVKTINNEKMKNTEDILNKVKNSKPGDKLEIIVFREGENKTIHGKIGEVPK